jgi:predicted LPLAT superfamily acyltransferase
MSDTDQHPPLPTSSAPSKREAPEGWSEKGIGRNWQHRFFYWLIRLGGKRRGYHMAHLVTFWYVLLYPSIRRRCRFYLDRRFPERRGPFQRFLDTYRLVRSYGSTLVDALVLHVLGPAVTSVTSPDHDRLITLSTGERGMVLIHAHVGSWWIGMSTLRLFPKRVSVVRIPEPRMQSPVDPQVVATIDPRNGLQSAMQMTDALLEGGILVMSGDRTLGSEQTVVPAQFLGGRVLLPIAPYRLASVTGVPVVVMTAPRIDENRHELRLETVIEVPPGLGRNPWNYAPYAQLFADCIERFVREHPWQFFNFYNFWRDSCEGGE